MCYWDCTRVNGRRTKPKASLTGISELKSLWLWWFLSFLANCSILWAAIFKIPRWWIYWMLNWSSSFPWPCFPSWMVCYQRLKQSLSVCRLLVLQHQMVSGWELSAWEQRCCSASATQMTGDWVFPHIQPSWKFSSSFWGLFWENGGFLALMESEHVTTQSKWDWGRWR